MAFVELQKIGSPHVLPKDISLSPWGILCQNLILTFSGVAQGSVFRGYFEGCYKHKNLLDLQSNIF